MATAMRRWCWSPIVMGFGLQRFAIFNGIRSSWPRAACTSIAQNAESRAFTRSVVMRCAPYASFGAKTSQTPMYSFLSGVDQ